MKKIGTVFLAVLLLAVVGCESTPKTEEQAENAVWTAPATEKILQEEEVPAADRGSSLQIYAAKGEYESGQIIVSAGGDIGEYSAAAGDLSAQGGALFKAENIALYHEKYIEVARNYEGNGAPAGMYPDTLLPMQTAAEYGENRVEAGKNQGIYVTFHIPKDQATGVYRGSITITLDGETHTVPVELKVYDFSVSEEVHSKSIFLTQWHYQSGELNSTQEMLDAYTEKLIEYRLAPQYVVTDTAHTDEDIAYYVDKACGYLKDPACSNLCIPYATRIIEGQECIDPDIFAKYLRAFAEKSFAENFNLLAKLYCYFNIIDEPDLQGTTERVKVVQKYFRQTLEQVAAEIESGTGGSAALRAEVAQSIRDMKSVVTCPYMQALEGHIDTWCPKVDEYDYNAALYADQEEKWWYTCNNPKSPYPTFHTEDTLLSARAVGWMMNEYDVVGNLYWATNIYASNEDGVYQPLDDYFGSASRFPNINGDGYLFYPGGQYGLEEPIASMRLEAFRDGLEEYETGLMLEEEYGALAETLGIENTFGEIYENVTSGIYSGTQVATDSSAFYAARRNLYQLAALARSEANVCIMGFEDDRYGNIVYEVYAKDGYTLKNGGAALTPSSTENGYSRYRIEIHLTGAANGISLSVETDGGTLVFEKDLGGAATLYAAESLVDGIGVLDGATVTAETVPALAGEGTWLHISLGDAPANEWQNFKWENAIVDGIGRQTSRLVLHVYYGGDAPLRLTVSAKYDRLAIYSDMLNVTLMPGMNTVELNNLNAYNWDSLGGIECLIFYLGEGKEAAANDGLYFVDALVYGV